MEKRSLDLVHFHIEAFDNKISFNKIKQDNQSVVKGMPKMLKDETQRKLIKKDKEVVQILKIDPKKNNVIGNFKNAFKQAYGDEIKLKWMMNELQNFFNFQFMKEPVLEQFLTPKIITLPRDSTMGSVSLFRRNSSLRNI